MVVNISWKKQKEEQQTVLKSEAELREHFIRKLCMDSEEMNEEEKAKMLARIEGKLKAGKKLTAEEAKFLRETNPRLYMQYQRIRATADAMATRLKHARSKQHANNIITSSISAVPEEDPYKEYLIAALQDVAKSFKKHPAYSRLPEKDADLSRKKAGSKNNEFEYGEADDWSPIQEVIETLPTFNVMA